MNRIISINIKGLIFQIEEDAFDQLDQYLRRLKKHFSQEDSHSEILDDIESRIAEMLSREPGVNNSVSLKRVNEIIEQMGEPAEFAEEEEKASGESYHYYSRARKLYRDGESKMLGGVCSGLGAYFDLDPLWIRIAFLFAFFTFGTGLLLYLILWVLLPEARTPSERLEMRGEPINVDNIEKSVKAEFNRIKKNFNETEWKERTSRAANQAGDGLKSAFKTLLSIALKFIGAGLVFGSLAVLVVCGLIYFGFLTDLFRTPFYPFFSNLFEDALTGVLFQVFLVLLFLLPVVAILYSGLKLLLGASLSTPWIGRIIGGLWGLSLLATIGLVFYLSNSWRDHASLSEDISLQTSDTFHIQSTNQVIFSQKFYNLEFGQSRGIRGIYALENDSLKRPVKLNIHVISTGAPSMKATRHSNGESYEKAASLASNIRHELAITENTLVFNPYYAVPESDVWKNQQMEYDLYLPIGTTVVFGNNTSTFLNNVSTDQYIHTSELEGKSFVVTEKGLHIRDTDSKPTAFSDVYDFSQFEEISLNGIPDALLYESEEFTVSKASDCNFEPQFKQIGKKLVISLPPKFFGRAKGLMKIGLPKLRRLEVNGGSNVSIQFRNQDECKIELNGSVQLEGLFDGKMFSLEANGFNGCRLNGSCDKLEVDISGTGKYLLAGLKSHRADVEADGAATVSLYVSESLKVDANGASEIGYTGNPAETEIEATGNSTVKPELPKN